MFDWMGMTVRTDAWRYSLFCAWDGTILAADWTNCSHPELYDHRSDDDTLSWFDPDHVETDPMGSLHCRRDTETVGGSLPSPPLPCGAVQHAEKEDKPGACFSVGACAADAAAVVAAVHISVA